MDPITGSETPYVVYIGSWINWSKGRVLGATLTLKRQDGNLIIAFIAFFVAVVATRLWRIACLTLHFRYSTVQAVDAIHHQRQVILRNTYSPEDSAYLLFRVARAWRGKAMRPITRLAPLLLLAISFVASFIIAGGYSSRISIGGSEVLLSGVNCAQFYDDGNHTLGDILIQSYTWLSKSYGFASNYAQQCYSVNSTGIVTCNTLTQRSLPMIVNTSASCPFSDKLCKSQDSNLIVESDIIDSHEHLGLNAPPDERIQLRVRFHCAPLVTEGFKDSYNQSSDQSYTQYNYGPSYALNYTDMTTFTNNYTSIFSNDVRHVAPSSSPSYQLRSHEAFWKDGSLVSQGSSFSPISELVRSDGDLTISFLSAGGIRFTNKTSDLWYSAQTPAVDIINLSSDGGRMPTYWLDEVASPLGCVSQEQFCNPNHSEGNRCTPWSGSFDIMDYGRSIFKDEASFNRFSWILQTSQLSGGLLSPLMLNLGAEALTSRYGLQQGLQGPLPKNQWQLDVQHWMGTTLALVQLMFVNTATGPSDPSLTGWFRSANNTQEQAYCNNQKILSTSFMSISIFGLCFVLVAGAIIIIISYTLEPFLLAMAKRTGRGSYAHLEWSTNQTLQLQRLVHEGLGMGNWSNTTDTVPVTDSGERLAVLDLSDIHHPRFHRHEEVQKQSSGEDKEQLEGSLRSYES